MDKKIVRTITERCLGYRKGEELLIITDDKLEALAYNFYRTAQLLGVESVIMQMPAREMHGQEPPRAIGAALKEADAAVLLTSMSLSHTKARKEASAKYGTRIASLPGATMEMLKRSICLNYAALHRKVAWAAGLLRRGKRIEVYTKKGTHLVMSIDGRKGFSDDGLYAKNGAFGNLPAGEACVAPREGTTTGCLVIDGSSPLTGKIKKPIVINIKSGYAQNLPHPGMKSLVDSVGRCALNIAEFGIGLNPKAAVTGSVLEDEKAERTAHIAFGNNKSFGGGVSCPCHLDFVFFDPVIMIDRVRLKI